MTATGIRMTADELQTKVDQWLRAGSLQVWVLYPATRSAMAFRADGSVTLVESPEVCKSGSR